MDGLLGGALSALAVSIGIGLWPSTGLCEKQYGPGVSDTEITIGQTMAYSGAASLYGTIGRAQAAYFDKINAEGGVNGRRIKLISLDDGYSPPKTVEQTRKLVEQETVLLMFSALGTGPNAAVHEYLNTKQVPQLFIASTGMNWNDPRNFPWTIAFAPNQETNLAPEVHYLLRRYPRAKVAILYENTDYGKHYLRTLKNLLGEGARKIVVAEASYEVSDPTVDTQIITLKGSRADTLFNLSTAKFAAQAIRKVHDAGWRPLHFLPSAVASTGTVLKPAGLERSIGVISVAYMKDPTDPSRQADRAVREYLAWLRKYYPQGDAEDIQNVYAYCAAQLLVKVLMQCGDNLTRANVMRKATSIKDFVLPMLLPGITINTSPTDFLPVERMQLIRFNGKRWVPLGK